MMMMVMLTYRQALSSSVATLQGARASFIASFDQRHLFNYRHHFVASPLSSASSNEDGATEGKGGKKKEKKKPKKSDGDLSKKTFRLDRLLSNRGVGSRMEVTALIRRGKVKTQEGQQVK